MDKEAHINLFNKIKREFPHITSLITVDDKGQSIANSNPSEVTDFSFREWFKVAKTGKDYASKMFISALTGKPTVTVAKPIFQNDVFMGVLTAGIYVEL